MKSSSSSASTYFPIVIISKETDQMVACGTVFLELKFIRGLASAAHIEDIAVDKNVQGKGLGKRIINVLTLVAEGTGAYKTILDCSEGNKGGFRRVERGSIERRGSRMSVKVKWKADAKVL